MDWLNYHHLYYFWVTAREGSVTRAARKLRLAPSTVSSQIRTLEQALEHQLFERRGGGLELTEAGRLVLGYGDEIFALGTELRSALGARPKRVRLRVGVAKIVPKLVAFRLLAPMLHGEPAAQLVCHEDTADRLVADLALHQLDVVIADAPVGLARELHAESRELGECGIAVMGTPELAARHRDGFPASLQGAPFLMPGLGTTMRTLLDEWFDRSGLGPEVLGEFADSALLKAFAQEGVGLAPVPTLIMDEVSEQLGLAACGIVPGVRERFFAFTMARRAEDPMVRRLLEQAHGMLEHPGSE